MDEPRPRLQIETSEGDLVIELWPDIAPETADNFQQLIHDGFYDGLTFHRIIPKFIVQGGCPVGDGTGNPGWNVDAEFNDQPHEKGTLSMARQPTDPHSAGSQFFICLSREYCAHLDGQYTAFGRVIKGMDTLDRLAETPLAHPETGSPMDPPQIIHAYEMWHDEEDEEDHHFYGDHDEDFHHDEYDPHPAGTGTDQPESQSTADHDRTPSSHTTDASGQPDPAASENPENPGTPETDPDEPSAPGG